MQTGGIDLSSQSSGVCLVGLGWLKGFRNPHPTGSARFARRGSARTRIAARSVDATAEASASSASSRARFFAVSKGGIRRLGGRLPDDGVKGLASPSAGAGAGAAAAEAMAAAMKWLPLSTIRSRQREWRLLWR